MTELAEISRDAGWRPLIDELDAWAAAGAPVTLWWRDDDATAPTSALDRLMGLAHRFGAPLALAVIPARAEAALAEALAETVAETVAKTPADADAISVLQHGYAHKNYAPRGQGLGAWEVGPHRPREQVLDELAQGRARLEGLFGGQFVPVLVPPWNRIDPALVPALPAAGLHGLSAWGPRMAALPAPGVRQVNAHADALRWKKDGARFAGPGKLAGELVGHLAARRTGAADPTEPTGFLTHHLEMTEDAWAGTEALLDLLATHRADIRWLSAAALFPGGDGEA